MTLFSPLAVASLHLPNRLLMAPVKTALAAPGGAVTQPLVEYYRRRAQGGVGTIISEPMFIDPRGKEHPKQVAIDDDSKVDGLKKITTAVHQAGGKIFAHINHAGRAANPKASGQVPEAPSSMLCGSTGAQAEAMTEARAEEIIQRFVAAGKRAKQADFDGVELQCGLGYLIAQFWSARTNQRRDKFGGDDDKRQSFAQQVLSQLRVELGPDFAISARLSADEKAEGGLDLDAAISMAKKLESWGINVLHVVTGSACDTPPWYYQHMSLPEAVNQKLAAAIKKQVNIPVIVAGRMAEPATIHQVLADGMADLVALGRPLVADPDLPNKMRADKDDQVIQCGSCLQGCLASVKAGQPIGCIVNPELGHEAEPLPHTNAPQKLVVVGGGPAGMSLAVQAQALGHEVILFEKGQLGGQFALAPLAPGKAGMNRPLRALQRATRASGATIYEQTEADPTRLSKLEANQIILATGADPVELKLPGFEQAVTGNQVLAAEVKVGAKVLVVGGGLIGMEVSELLIAKGHEVTVVELLDEVARDMEMITRKLTMMRLKDKPIKIMTGSKISRFDDGMATISDTTGQQQIGPFDSLVVAAGTRPNRQLAQALNEQGVNFETIGDAAEVNQIMGAVRSARALLKKINTPSEATANPS